MFVTTVAAPQAQAAYLGDRLLVYSMQGYDVQQLQKNLAYLNYYHGNIDGIFGSQTLAAVKQYQLQYGLMVDGMVGKQTAGSLINEVSKPQPGSATPFTGSHITFLPGYGMSGPNYIW
jgi:N-acetylmuramoyl-L-alanine amidase